jgi:hypothetical protein
MSHLLFFLPRRLWSLRVVNKFRSFLSMSMMETRFHPEILGNAASSALGITVLEVFSCWLGMYLLSIADVQLLDVASFFGYKFVSYVSCMW